MNITLDEVNEVVIRLSSALGFAKQAQHVAKKVHGDPREVTANLRLAYGDIMQATKILEMRGER